MLPLLVNAALLAFSTGGGEGVDERGNPFLQACDAISLCRPHACPPGMTAVAPPERSAVYSFGVISGTTTYVPGQLLPFELNVTRRLIQGKRDQGRTLVANETSKYLGILLYAVNRRERKVGTWELPVSSTSKFWLPPDPACEGRSLMHTDAQLKGYQERFVFRAPPAGTGPISFRVLVKQGETNKGAFYWPVAPASGSLDEPTWGSAGSDGDLTLGEASGEDGGGAVEWISAYARGTEWRPQRCTDVCVEYGLRCDEASLQAARSEEFLLPNIENEYLCALPLLAGCDAAPRMSGLGDGYCWYRDTDRCAAPQAGSASLCDEMPQPVLGEGIRLCACVGGAAATSRARRRAQEHTDHTAAHEPMDADTPRSLADAAWKREAEWMREAAEATAARVAAAGGCPSAKLALRRAEAAKLGNGGIGDTSLLASSAACPQYRAAALLAHGGDLSDGALTADFELDVALTADEESDAAGSSNGSGSYRDVNWLPHSSFVWLAPLAGAAALAVVGVGAWLRRGRGGRLNCRSTAIGALTALPAATGHNWMRGGVGSRCRKTCTQRPCPRRRSHIPNVRVNRGQPFNIGFATGHGGHIWATLLHADDERYIGSANLVRYLFEAPPEARSRYLNGFWQKHHFAGGRYLEAQYYSSRGMRHVGSINEVVDGDVPDMMIRGADDYWAHRRQHSPGNSAMGLWRFPRSEAQLLGSGSRWADEIVAYTNPRYPWIQAVYKIGIRPLHPLENHIQRVEFPRHLVSSGNHILHWQWRGYRDCIDIEVLPDSKRLRNHSREMMGYQDGDGPVWNRIDHAHFDIGTFDLFRARRNGNADTTRGCYFLPPPGERSVQLGLGHEETFQRLKDMCTQGRSGRYRGSLGMGCQAIQCVPLVNPPDVPVRATDGLKATQSVHEPRMHVPSARN